MHGFSLYVKSSKESITGETLLCESLLSSLNRHFMEPQTTTFERTEWKTLLLLHWISYLHFQNSSWISWWLTEFKRKSKLTLRSYIFKQGNSKDEYGSQSHRKSLRNVNGNMRTFEILHGMCDPNSKHQTFAFEAFGVCLFVFLWGSMREKTKAN